MFPHFIANFDKFVPSRNKAAAAVIASVALAGCSSPGPVPQLPVTGAPQMAAYTVTDEIGIQRVAATGEPLNPGFNACRELASSVRRNSDRTFSIAGAAAGAGAGQGVGGELSRGWNRAVTALGGALGTVLGQQVDKARAQQRVNELYGQCRQQLAHEAYQDALPRCTTRFNDRSGGGIAGTRRGTPSGSYTVDRGCIMNETGSRLSSEGFLPPTPVIR